MNKPDCMTDEEFQDMRYKCEKGIICGYGICDECEMSNVFGTNNGIWEQIDETVFNGD